MNMKAHAVFIMFVDFKTGCGTISRQRQKEGRQSTRTVLADFWTQKSQDVFGQKLQMLKI